MNSWLKYGITTCKGTSRATPVLLAYGVEAIVPVEIIHALPRIEAIEANTKEDDMKFSLDLMRLTPRLSNIIREPLSTII